MAGIFTRKAITAILNTEDLTPEERAEQLFSLYGRAIDDGYVTKSAAEAAKNEAVAAAQKNAPAPGPVDVKQAPEYQQLQTEFEAYKAREQARRSDDFKGVKDKFFDVVYDKLDRGAKAQPIADQLTAIREQYEEYFVPDAGSGNQPGNPEPSTKPQFGAQTQGQMPSGDQGAADELTKLWGFGKK